MSLFAAKMSLLNFVLEVGDTHKLIRFGTRGVFRAQENHGEVVSAKKKLTGGEVLGRRRLTESNVPEERHWSEEIDVFKGGEGKGNNNDKGGK